MITCEGEDKQVSEGQELGPALRTLTSADLSGSGCPVGYGVGPEQQLVSPELTVRFHVSELSATSEPVLSVSNPIRHSSDVNNYVDVTGERFNDHETVQVALVDSHTAVYPLGVPSKWCGRGFHMHVPTPLLPGGDYVARATRADGTHFDAPTSVLPMLEAKPGGGGVHFKGFSFGAGDTITAQHWITALPIGNAPRVVPDAPIGGQDGLVGVVDSVPPTVTADGRGSFEVTVGPGKMPPGYQAPPADLSLRGRLRAAMGSGGPSELWRVTGKPSNLVKTWRPEVSETPALPGEHVTMEPNHNLGVDPVSLLGDFDRGALYQRGGPVSMGEVEGYLAFRARNSYRAPLPAATLEQLARRVGAARAAFASGNVAAAHQAMRQVKSALPAARAHEAPMVTDLRRWAQDTDVGLDVLSQRERAALDRELVPIRESIKRGDRTAARAQITALSARLPSLMRAPQAARVRQIAADAQRRLQR